MAIKFACPYCDKVSSVPDSFAGKKGKCPACNKIIEVPDPNADVEDSVPAGDGGGADDGGETKECRYCGETIKKVAKKCKYCGEFLDKSVARTQRKGARPATNLGLALAATLLCCWPIGIVAVIYAAQVNSKYNAGDLEGARAASQKAKAFAYWAMGLGVVAIIIQIAIMAANS